MTGRNGSVRVEKIRVYPSKPNRLNIPVGRVDSLMGNVAVMRPLAAREEKMKKSIYRVLGLAVFFGALLALGGAQAGVGTGAGQHWHRCTSAFAIFRTA